MTINVDSVRASHPLESVVQRFTGQEPVKHKILAPWRTENTPSVHIYPNGTFKDYGGEGWRGDVIDFVGYYHFGPSYDPATHFTQVVDMLGGLNITPLPPRPTVAKPTPLPLRLNRDDILRWHVNMPPERRAYWHSRGLADTTINEFELGWDGKRYTIPLLYRNVPFGVKRRQSEIEDGIEYKYTQIKGSRPGLFNGDVLNGVDSVTICEGEIDAMTLHQFDYPAVTCTSGAGTWKPEWASLFSHVRHIWILYDNDAAGMTGAMKVHQTLRRAKIVHLPDGIKDVGELFEKVEQPCKWLDGVLK
jgi:5S rRNA maturation endonuclease (ribonuclease M5)